MIRCGNCGKEVEEGRNFCPYCAQPLAVEAGATRERTGAPDALQKSEQGRERFLEERDLEAPRAVPFATPRDDDRETAATRRKLFAVIAAVSLLLVAGLVYLATRPSAPHVEPRLEGALRPGTPEFDQYRDRLVLEFDQEQNAQKNSRALGDVVVTFRPVIRNFTGRTISGLELRAVINNQFNEPIKQRTFVRQVELAPNKVLTEDFIVEGLKADDVPDVIRPGTLSMEITGVKFK